MSYGSFVSRAGFSSDPFASTNSDKEIQLSAYFVPPPYFASVIGEPAQPEPTIVFAPRGTGKSALRRMVEERGAEESSQPFLALSYVDFEWAGSATPGTEAHQLQIARLLTLAILTALDAEPEAASKYLEEHDRSVVKTAASALLSSLSTTQYRAAMGSVKSLQDKAGEAWQKYGGVVATVVGALMSKAGIDGASVDRNLISSEAALTQGAKDLLVDLTVVAQKLGWHSIYILVDRVDETSATSNSPETAFRVVQTLLTSLPTLEQEGLAYKFFLWDQTEQYFKAAGGRADRVMTHRLRWSVTELAEMLSRRLSAHSAGSIDSFNALVAPDVEWDVHALICHLAHGSPRDMIRIAKQIIAEATRSDPDKDLIDRESVLVGIGTFSRIRVEELFPRFERDFARVPTASFTTPQLANDVFRITTQAMRQKILQWAEVGAVVKLGEPASGASRPVHVYAFTDPRIVVRSERAGAVEQGLNHLLHECPACRTIVIGSGADFNCSQCGTDIATPQSRSLLAVVKL